MLKRLKLIKPNVLVKLHEQINKIDTHIHSQTFSRPNPILEIYKCQRCLRLPESVNVRSLNM
jgi:hypothetical protein